MVQYQLHSKLFTWSVNFVPASFSSHQAGVDWVEARATPARAAGEGFWQNKSQESSIVRTRLHYQFVLGSHYSRTTDTLLVRRPFVRAAILELTLWNNLVK